MILIADSGSTKTNWCLLDGGKSCLFFDTEGYNPYFVSSDNILGSMRRQLPESVNADEVTVLFFYGAGCFDDKIYIIKDALKHLFRRAEIHVHLDLLASARATLGNEAGFVGILGTGSNSCLYDGKKIISNIDSLGYLLGDEGSGFYLGRRVLGDYIRGYMPAAVEREFFDKYGYTREAIMDRVYSERLPNRYCAGFAGFLQESVQGSDYARKIVRGAFSDFFEHLVCHYKDYASYTFNCIGSVGDTWREILTEVATSYGMKTGKILKAPIAALAAYHVEN